MGSQLSALPSRASTPIRVNGGHLQGASGSSAEQTDTRKAILLLGPRDAGKTAIIDLIFHHMEASTSEIYRLHARLLAPPLPDASRAFTDFQIWDVPGPNMDADNLPVPFSSIGAVIFVLDSQKRTTGTADSSHKMAAAMMKIHYANPRVLFEVFLHKSDGMSHDLQIDMLDDVRQRVFDVLADVPAGTDGEAAGGGQPDYRRGGPEPTVNFHLTSIFDHSIFEELSKVIQKLLTCQASLERLLDSLCQSSHFDKAFLFHLPTKLYVGTDSSPVDSSTYEICSDFIDLCVDFVALYGHGSTRRPSTSASTSRDQSPAPLSAGHSPDRSMAASPSSSLRQRARATSRVRMSEALDLAHWEIDSCVQGRPAIDARRSLCLVALLRGSIYDKNAAILEYNVHTFRQGVLAVKAISDS